MDDRLKERLTGAVLLVAIVVLLVPQMFRGGATTPADSPSTLLASGDLTAASAVATTAPMAATSPAAEPSSAQTFTLDSTPVPAELPRAAPQAAVVAPAPVTALPPKPAAAPSKRWVIQVGSFSVRENAEKMVKQGARAGLKLQVAGPDDRGFYRVRSPVLPDRAAALKLQARYRELGFKSLISSAP